MTEQLFRILHYRPPLAQNPDNPSIKLTQPSELQRQLIAAASNREALIKAVQSFVSGPKFVPAPDATPFQKRLQRFANRLDALSAGGALSLRAVLTASQEELGSLPKDVVASQDFKALEENLRDSVIALKFNQGSSLEPLTVQLRDLELLKKASTLNVAKKSAPAKAASDDKSKAAAPPPQWQAQTVYMLGSLVVWEKLTYVCIQAHTSVVGWEPPKTPALWVRSNDTVPEPDAPEVDLIEYRKRSIALPIDIELGSVIAEGQTPNDPKDDGGEAEAGRIIDRYTNLSATIKELLELEPVHFQSADLVPDDGVKVDERHKSNTLQIRKLDLHNSFSDALVKKLREPATGGPGDEGVTAPTADLAKDLLGKPTGLTPRAPFVITPEKEHVVLLKSTAPLSKNAQTTIASRGLSLTDTSVDEIVENLEVEMKSQVNSLRRLAPDVESTTYTRIGNAFVKTRIPIKSRAAEILLGVKFRPPFGSLPILPIFGRVPKTKGKVRQVGIGDLLVVKQQLKGYEAADVAHIENVLKGESKNREHTSTSRQDVTSFTETELITAEENEITTASRFEMSKESSETLKEDQALKAGIQISAKYGPVVEVAASLEGSMSRSREEINRSASQFSQDVTERTSKKIAERSLQRETIRTISETVEKNTHALNNTAGTANVSGVYQWVNKVYEAQVYNYGVRAMFDFMIPEPATFMIEAMKQTASQKVALEAPLPFTLNADDIEPQNYLEHVTKYGATDVRPPPDLYVRRSEQIYKEGGEPGTDYNYGSTITIPNGYKAVFFFVAVAMNTWEDDADCEVLVGGRRNRVKASGKRTWQGSLPSMKGEISWGVNSYHAKNFVITVDIKCQRSDRAMKVWRHDTHQKLMTAYEAKMQEYEDKLAQLKLQAGVIIEGRNPVANLKMIKQELKKDCITLITGQHYGLFNSLRFNMMGLPEMNLEEADAEGAYVRFFEQAFEWDQLMYITYPYFWGGKTRWVPRLSFDDPDPVFDEFLKSGFARVVVPARQGFIHAIDHFLKFGEVWMGGPLPAISSPLYLQIADEIAEREGKPQGELPQGDPWTVRVPTKLVKLRQDDKLPTWTKNADGEWVPVAE